MKTALAKSFFLSPNFFSAVSAIIFLLAFGFAFPIVFIIAKIALIAVVATVLADFYMLYRRGISIIASRNMARVLGLGDDTTVHLTINYQGNIVLKSRLIDELPVQLQERKFLLEANLEPGINRFKYQIKPIDKGVYNFGKLNILVESPIGFVRRKIALPIAQQVPVYPSVQQMHELELLAFSRVSSQIGSKRSKRIGQSYEFEQISPFVEGDDYRNINWKATGKTRELLVNQYQDERSQNLYCIISKGRAMKMAFGHMTFMDYAINSTLAISNVALKKYDKVGMLTFSDKIGTALRADNRQGQLQKILEALYHEKERDLEPSYELLYQSIKRVVKSRSLLLLYANFESPRMLDRVLPILRKISKGHVLVMVLFKDDELAARAKAVAESIPGIYQATLAQQHLSEKDEIAFRLRRQGIQVIVSSPSELSLNVINKYLELKTRGVI